MKYTKNRGKEFCIDGSGNEYCQNCMQKKDKIVQSMMMSYCGVNGKLLRWAQLRFAWCIKNEYEVRDNDKR